MKIKFLLFVFCLLMSQIIWSQQLGQYILQPYWGEAKIRVYDRTVANPNMIHYTIDLSTDVKKAFGVAQGINMVLIKDTTIFVSIDAGNGSGGVLVYHYSDLYPLKKTTGPFTTIKPNGGLPTAGICIQPSTGNLFVATSFSNGADAGIFSYTASSKYATGSLFASYNNDPSIAGNVANLAFDTKGNLWVTEFDNLGQYLICYKNGSNSPNTNYYAIVNPSTKIYPSTTLGSNGSPNNPTLNLLSQPEGIAFDKQGNLFIANNNDDFPTNGFDNNGQSQGSLVKLSVAYLDSLLKTPADGTSRFVPTAAANVYHIKGSKLGGLSFNEDTLYINDQGQNQGTVFNSSGTVWKWNVKTSFTNTNVVASGIHTTYPGNGTASMNNVLTPFSVLLPLNIIHFTVAKNNNADKLQWQLNDETDLTTIEVEYSHDGTAFAKVASLLPNKEKGSRYSFNYFPTNDVRYYRLKLVLKEHNNLISSAVKMNSSNENRSLVYPNPSIKSCILSIQDKSLIGTKAIICDIKGKLVSQQTIIGLKMQLNFPTLPPGSYFLKLSNGEIVNFIKE